MKPFIANAIAIIGVIGISWSFVWLYIRANYGNHAKGIWMLFLFPVITPVLIIKEWQAVKEPALLLLSSVALTIGAYIVGW